MSHGHGDKRLERRHPHPHVLLDTASSGSVQGPGETHSLSISTSPSRPLSATQHLLHSQRRSRSGGAPRHTRTVLCTALFIVATCCVGFIIATIVRLTAAAHYHHHGLHGAADSISTALPPLPLLGTSQQGSSQAWTRLIRRKKEALAASEASHALPSMAHYLQKAKSGPFPVRLKYPVVWAGAFFSRSGYGTEAVSYLASLLQSGLVAAEDVWVAQSGDHLHEEVVQTMDPGLCGLLQGQQVHNVTQRLSPLERDRPIISVCHSFPDCWRIPRDDDRFSAHRMLKAIGDFFKYSVWGATRRDNGCPCPHESIKDRVVYRVGRTMFETETLPRPLAAYADHMDEVWVPSEFNRDSFAASGIPRTKLYTLAQGLNTSLFDPDTAVPVDLEQLGGELVAGTHASSPSSAHSSTGGQSGAADVSNPGSGAAHAAHQPRSVLDDMFNVAQPAADQQGSSSSGAAGRPYRFLSVFKWEMRKGWDILLRAYASEFKADEDVELHIVTKEAFEKVKDFRSYVRHAAAPHLNISSPDDEAAWARLPRVILHYHHIPEPQYPGVYKVMDALVIPTHGEGWGRPQIEAMAMGLPVISTNWSGITAFMDDKVAYPIRVAGVVPVHDSGPNSFEWFIGQRWAQPDEQHLRALMRSVFTMRSAAAAKGQLARERVQREFSETAVAHALLAQLLRLQDTVDLMLATPVHDDQDDATTHSGSSRRGRLGSTFSSSNDVTHAADKLGDAHVTTGRAISQHHHMDLAHAAAAATGAYSSEGGAAAADSRDGGSGRGRSVHSWHGSLDLRSSLQGLSELMHGSSGSGSSSNHRRDADGIRRTRRQRTRTAAA